MKIIQNKFFVRPFTINTAFRQSKNVESLLNDVGIFSN